MKVLIVSYYFPPYNTIGAVRVGKWAKYLVSQGHEVVVLTAKEQPLPASLPVELDEKNIIRTHWINVNWLPEKLVGGREKVAREGFSSKGHWHRAFRRAGLIYKSIANFPDGQIGWYWPAIGAGKWLLEVWKPDIIYASAMPFTSLIVASRLSRLARVPWIAELRDLWVDGHNYEYGMFRRFFESRLERRTLSSAKGIVTVSEPLAQKLLEKYHKPVIVILNGYDPNDYIGLASNTEYVKKYITITYTGSIYERKYDLHTFLAAVRMLPKEKRSRIRVRFLGRRLDLVRSLSNKYNLDDLISIEPTAPYSESLKAQAKSDILLLFLWNDPRERGVYSGKLFEYIGAGRPILAVGPKDNVAADLIREHGLGAVVSTEQEALAALNAILDKQPPFDSRSLSGTDWEKRGIARSESRSVARKIFVCIISSSPFIVYNHKTIQRNR